MESFLRHAVKILRQGGIIVYPTETAYGLGCDATNRRAAARLFKIKGRDKGKPLPLIVADRKMAERYAKMTPLALRLASTYWPGALTLVLKKQGNKETKKQGGLAFGVTHRGTVAMRVSAHPVAHALVKGLGRPMVATSANRSGEPACYSVGEVMESLFNCHSEAKPKNLARMRVRPHTWEILRYAQDDAIGLIDAGRIPKRKPSTIADATGEIPKILRQGAIKL